MDVLTKKEINYLEQELKRKANEIEQDAVGAQWSEHCSYKSSKKYLQLLPTKGKHVVVGPGYDAGVLDVGDGYVLTVHIESHNHPSAIEPFGGAATGVGGVVRDIMSMGTRPIAVLDALRFAPILDDNNHSVAKSKWLFKNVVKGIADYGNCIGIRTVGGEIEFDPSFQDYCLVDVAAIGFGRKDDIITNEAQADDIIILAGGSTGRDGIRGASFASKTLEEENRSAVQIPDPFLEKLLLEATMEAVEHGCLKCIKDLGGGGLSCCLSETSDNLGMGFDIELTKIHTRESHMMPNELMISESQERMLYITDKPRLSMLQLILSKYGIKYSIIGTVKEHQDLVVRHSGKVVMHMPSHLVAHAPLADRAAKRPTYIDKLKRVKRPVQPSNLAKVLVSLLANPTIASKRWVYQQYDHEVGIRTVIKPGAGDAAVMRLDNGKFVAVKLDGNSKHCYLDPYQGTLGCLSEGLRNIVCTGAEPIGVVDHLQFASPEDPEIYWTFVQTVNAIAHYCMFMEIPVVGGKVSFYNETAKGPIKPSPVIGTLGLVESESFLTQMAFSANESIFIVGHTQPEMGGSEYYEYFHKITGGTVPQVDLKVDMQNRTAVLNLIRTGLVKCAHDCSKGGIAVALAEMAIAGLMGFKVQLDSVPNSCKQIDELLFSETQSRYIIATKDPETVYNVLSAKGVRFAEIGKTIPSNIKFIKGEREVIRLSLKQLQSNFYLLEKTLQL
ncbi:MAG: phosphoribosylformylglycinamidine synthase subunit PurL [Thermoproteota archaeon]|nr:phosphoribosylformylglycinamidine synthase subunit PurL [Thermoproteota archaeon]